MLVPLEKPESNIRFAQKMDKEKFQTIINDNIFEIEKHAWRIGKELKTFENCLQGVKSCAARGEWHLMKQVLGGADKALKEIELFATALRKGNGQWVKDFNNYVDANAPK